MAVYGTLVNSDASGGYAFRNRIINGSFLIWQRGTSGSSAASFVADRWIINSNNTSHARSSDAPTGFVYSLLMTGTSATNAQATQKIESIHCIDMVGQPMVISFWAKSTSGSTTLGVYANYANASDDFSSTTTIGSNQFTLNSTWTKYSFVVTTSAPAGTTNGIQLGLYRYGTESSATYITGVQIEKGIVPTPFDVRPYTLELAMCQRYFQFVPRTNCWPRDTGSFIVPLYPPVLFRGAPSVTLSTTSPYIESLAWSSVGSITSCTVSNGHLNYNGGDILVSGTSSSISSGSYCLNFGGNQILVSAEL